MKEIQEMKHKLRFIITDLTSLNVNEPSGLLEQPKKRYYNDRVDYFDEEGFQICVLTSERPSESTSNLLVIVDIPIIPNLYEIYNEKRKIIGSTSGLYSICYGGHLSPEDVFQLMKNPDKVINKLTIRKLNKITEPIGAFHLFHVDNVESKFEIDRELNRILNRPIEKRDKNNNEFRKYGDNR